MDLFDKEIDGLKNHLPKDSVVNYHGKLFSHKEASHYFDGLINTIDWKNDHTNIFVKAQC